MRILAIDYGAKYLGLAISAGSVVKPEGEILYRKDNQLEADAVEQIKKLVESEGINKIVVGIPLIKGRDPVMPEGAEDFIEKIKFALPDIGIELVDEFKSSQEGQKLAARMGISRKKRQSSHAFAAAVILQRYLSGQSVL